MEVNIMRLGWSTNKYSTTYRAVKTIRVDGKNKTMIVKTFGSDRHICETYGVSDAKKWAQEQVDLMNEAEEQGTAISIEFSSLKDLPVDQQRCFNGGYLFLQQIYYELGLDRICRAVAKKRNFTYDLNSIFSRLIYTRILFPSSKRSSFDDSKRFIEAPDFELHQIYRALSVLAEESDYIQSRLFKNSLKFSGRKTGVIYYDCTNYYFEIEEASDDKQYGVSKENRPLPIVEMGLFMDSEGIPLAFNINPGNQNEQLSLIPLEKKLLADFGMSKFVVCTDAGLSSYENRRFNNYEDEDNNSRAYVTAQSIKKLKGHLKEWALDPKGWSVSGSNDEFDISSLDPETDKDILFYKRRWINENGLEQQLIVTYSLKYKNYLHSIRMCQVERAKKKVEQGKRTIERKRQNDPARFIRAEHATQDGEVADKTKYYIDEAAIEEEEKYDGFYAVCTDLEDDVETILKINSRRWEIEECFRIMKSDFAARPVYVQRQERIVAHFITCFIALIVYRYLEKKLDNKYTCSEILDCLREMNFLKFEGRGYIPTYTKTELTDALHAAFGFDTSKEIIPIKKMRKICADTKKTGA